jgi:GTP cyclohydrolase I
LKNVKGNYLIARGEDLEKVKKDLPDVQAYTSGFPKLPIQRVGMRNVEVPFQYRWPSSGQKERVLATIDSFTNLDRDHKGINMSRITRIIMDVMGDPLRSFSDFGEVAQALKAAHGSRYIQIQGRFVLPYQAQTPVSDLTSPETIHLGLESILDGDLLRNFLSLKSTEMSLCPCSKEMSLLKNNISAEERAQLDSLTPKLREKVLAAGFGAHNQKSQVELRVELAQGISLDPGILLKLVKNSVSSPTLTILKRPDEKYETEVAYMGAYIDQDGQLLPQKNGGPMFVEDIARNLSRGLDELIKADVIVDYRVEVNNEESIHSNGILATAVMGPASNS